jgi:predicted oxidoreductase (fatty acid repression mutant protein)
MLFVVQVEVLSQFCEIVSHYGGVAPPAFRSQSQIVVILVDSKLLKAAVGLTFSNDCHR